jgi:hypothetical protein
MHSHTNRTKLISFPFCLNLPSHKSPFHSTQYPNGGKYVYADANSPAFALSNGDLSSATQGAMAQTVAQVFHTYLIILAIFNHKFLILFAELHFANLCVYLHF